MKIRVHHLMYIFAEGSETAVWVHRSPIVRDHDRLFTRNPHSEWGQARNEEIYR